MITFGICLIYYGIALLVYQLNGWATEGYWTPFPVLRAWEAFFGPVSIESPFLRQVAHGLLQLPLSLTLLGAGFGTLAIVFGYRRWAETRRRQLRRKWIEEQCKTFGYTPWDVPKLLKELDDEVLVRPASRRNEG